MIVVRFPDPETERVALGFLAGRFPGKSWATGETIVPEAALAYLAQEGIKFTVEGPATDERARRGSWEKFDRVMKKVRDVPPLPGDEK